jgi:hypothetical protein
MTFNQYTTMTLLREGADAFTLHTNASLVVSQDSTKKWQTVHTLYKNLASIIQGCIDVTNVQQLKEAFNLKKMDPRLRYLETNSVLSPDTSDRPKHDTNLLYFDLWGTLS